MEGVPRDVILVGIGLGFGRRQFASRQATAAVVVALDADIFHLRSGKDVIVARMRWIYLRNPDSTRCAGDRRRCRRCPGQTVVVSAKLGREELVRAIAAASYVRGAQQVEIDYRDPYVDRIRYNGARGGPGRGRSPGQVPSGRDGGASAARGSG